MSNHQVDVATFYQGQNIFFTGGTGMVGMAYLSRVILDTPVQSVYALVRGGESRFWKELSCHLHESLVKALRSSGKLIILAGDITLLNCGLESKDIEAIRRNVSIIIHGASTINLKKALSYMVENIVNPSVAIAKLTLSCPNLIKFVYISSAFSSTFLRHESDGSVSGFDAVIKEDVNPIRSETTLDAELADLKTYGKTPEFTFVDYPYDYSYAKHLTERIILRDFEDVSKADKLLILRPTIIGPAESLPYPFYERPGSAPVTSMLAASIIDSPRAKVQYSSRLSDPSSATFDEIAVDIVVNRLIVHVAAGTTGVVHAAAGEGHCSNTEKILKQAVHLRRHRWGRPRFVWRDCGWKSDEVCNIGRLFVVIGCAFVFDNTKTKLVWEMMNERDREDWPLWATRRNDTMEGLEGRKRATKILAGHLLAKKGLSPSLTGVISML